MESILPNELADCMDSLDLITLLVMRSVTNVFTEQNKDFADIVAIYRWAITIKVGNHLRGMSGTLTNITSRLPTTQKSLKSLVANSIPLEETVLLLRELRSSA
jgi:hypothetical protein